MFPSSPIVSTVHKQPYEKELAVLLKVVASLNSYHTLG